MPPVPRPSREQVYAALFQLLLTANDQLPDELKFVTTGRKLLAWTDVPEPNQPAMFLKQGPQEGFQGQPKHASTVYTTGLPTWIWTCNVWIYFRLDAANLQQPVVPDQIVNAYIDAIEKVITGVPGQPGQYNYAVGGNLQTLASVNGGVPLVFNTWFDGTVNFDDGLLDNQGVISIPISILIGV